MWSKTPDILARNTGQGSWEGYSWRDHLNSTAVNYHATRGVFFHSRAMSRLVPILY